MEYNHTVIYYANYNLFNQSYYCNNDTPKKIKWNNRENK